MKSDFIESINFLTSRSFYCCLISFCLSTIFAQEVKLEKIFNLQPVKGLEHIEGGSTVFEDHLGYIWIGSAAGLYKFDGCKTIHYLYDPAKPDKIAGNWIGSITEDNEGNIWFGVFGIGLQKFNPANGKFTLYKDKEYGKTSLETIMNLLFYGDMIFISTQNGLCVLSTETEKIKYFPDIKLPNSFKINGNIWTLSRDHTLYYFDEKKDSLVRYSNLGIKSRLITTPIVVQDKIYMIDGQGNFYSYDNKSKKLELLSSTIYNKNYQSMLAIENHQIYIIGEQSFEIYDIKKNTFSTPKLNNTFANGDYFFSSPYKLKNGNIWFAGDKIYTAASKDQGIETYTLKSNNANMDLSTSAILNNWNNQNPGIGLSYLLDFEKQLAERVSVRYPQLSVFDSAYSMKNQYVKTYTDKNKDTWIAHQQTNTRKITIYHLYGSSNSLRKIGYVSKYLGLLFGITKIDDNLWIGGWGGLLKWNLLDGTETHYKAGKDAFSLTSENIRHVFKDSDDDLWVSTQNGLNLKKKNQDSFIHYFSIPGDTTSLSINSTSTIAQDSSGIIWIATFGGGVNSFDKKTGKFRWYTAKNGLADNNVNIIQVDDFQDVWAAHWMGISKIIPTTGKIKNFDKSNGIVSVGEHNSLKLSDGSLIFAGDGFNRIFPDRIKIDTFVPQLLITHLKLHNKDVLINGPDPVLHQNINVTKEITLKYKQNVITLEYAALDMVRADKRQYAYQLVGFDPDWQYVDKKREATYTNLPHGDYIFKVKSSMDEENWSEIQNPLMITILPPWWRTWWAYGIYLLLISYAGWKLHQYQKAKTIAKEREKAQERELEHAKEIEIAYTKLGTAHENLKSSQAQLIQSEKMASLGELTAGIAHEIQNPLNFVNNFSELNKELIGEMKAEIEKGDFEEVIAIANDIESNEEKINHHGKRADAIVKGMLQHSSSGSGKKEPTNINTLADEYLRLAYHGLRAKDKSFNADFQTNFDADLPKVNVIPQDIGRVLLNLINNAFYAVDEKKKSRIENYEPAVSVSTKNVKDKLEIRVKDNGSGIPDSIKEKIFQPFFTTKPTGQGTGLGLSLSYDIIKAHGGELKVETSEAMGSEFIVQLPL